MRKYTWLFGALVMSASQAACEKRMNDFMRRNWRVLVECKSEIDIPENPRVESCEESENLHHALLEKCMHNSGDLMNGNVTRS